MTFISENYSLKMSILLRLPFFLCIFLPSLSALSADIWHQSKIARVYPHGDGSFVIIFRNDSDKCPSTNNPKYHYVRTGYNNVDETAVDKIYSAALAAATMEKEVSVNFDDSTSKYFINRLIVHFDDV